MSAPFVEQRIPLGVNYGVLGGPSWDTTVLVQGDGKEHRNVNWSQPLHSYTFSRPKERPLTRPEMLQLKSFFEARQGRYEGFRFRDWADWQCPENFLGVGDGVRRKFQLSKLYVWQGNYFYRPIVKPVVGSVVIKQNGVVDDANWQIDYSTGEIICRVGVGVGIAITASCNFDVPVRFRDDAINLRHIAQSGTRQFYELQEFGLEEYRVSSKTTVGVIPPAQHINGDLGLGYDLQTVGGPVYSTSVNEAGQGFELRVRSQDNARGRWAISSRTYNRRELDNLLAAHWCLRGSATSFNYYDHASGTTKRVRFTGDSLRHQFIRQNSRDAFFAVTGLDLVECL